MPEKLNVSSLRKACDVPGSLRKLRSPKSKRPCPKGRPQTKPERVIADRAYDSDPLRERLKKRGIDLIVPYRENNKKRKHVDGRKFRRY